MSPKTPCPECGDPTPTSDGSCVSCGADLDATGKFEATVDMGRDARVPGASGHEHRDGDFDPDTEVAGQDAVSAEQPTEAGSTADGVSDISLNDPTTFLAADARRTQRETRNVREFGDYVIERRLAQGGMGVVYRARQKSLNRLVALKMIRSGELAGDEEVRRFQMEAESAAALDHPCIVPIYDVGEHDGQHFYTMAFIDGRSLAEILQDGPLPPGQAAKLVALLADAMQYAHLKGVIHRDLKPGNVLLVEQGEESRGSSMDRSSLGLPSSTGRGSSERSYNWQPKITDFGLAKRTQSDSDLTSAGQVLGTPSYMPPEQARGELDVGPTVDVYSLGAVMYATLVGRPPFQSATAVETIRQVLEQDPVPPSRFSNAIDRDLDTICLKCLEKSPSRRYRSAAELADDLYAYLDGRPVKARPVGWFEQGMRWCRRKPAAAMALFTGFAAALAVVILLLVSSQLEVAKAKSERLEQQAEARRQQLEAAEERARLDQQIAATNEYFAAVSRVRERNAFGGMGWAYKGLADIEKASQLPVEDRDAALLRSAAVKCLTGLDVRPIDKVMMPAGHRSHRLAVHLPKRRFAVASLKNRFQLYIAVGDLDTREVTRHLWFAPRSLLEFDGVRHVVFLDDGDTVAAVTRTGYLNRWDLTDPESEPTSVATPFREDEDIAFDAANNRAFVNHDDALYRWDDFSNSETTKILDDVTAVWDVRSDGRWICCRHEDRTSVVDTESLEILWQGETRAPGWFDHLGRVIVGDSGEFLVVDPLEEQSLVALIDPLIDRLHEGSVRAVQVSPDGTLLASTGADQTMKLWNLANGRLLMRVFVGGEDEVIARFTSDSELLVTGNRAGQFYELNGRDVASVIALHPEVHSFDYAHETDEVVVASRHRAGAAVQLFKVGGNRPTDAWLMETTPVEPQSVTTDPRGERVVVIHPNKDWAWVGLRDSKPDGEAADRGDAKEEETSLPPFAKPVRAKVRESRVVRAEKAWYVAPDFYTVEDKDQLVRRDPDGLGESLRWSNRLAGHMTGTGTIVGMFASEDSLFVGTKSGHLVTLSREDLKVQRLRLIETGATSFAIEEESMHAAYGNSGGDLAMVAVNNDENPEHYDAAHLDLITSLVFSPDGQLLVSGSRDRSIRLWRHSEGKITPVLRLQLERFPTRLRFRANGDLLAHLHGENGVRLWRLAAIRERLQQLNLDWE